MNDDRLQQQGLTIAVTTDRHFVQAGYHALMLNSLLQLYQKGFYGLYQFPFS